MGRFRCRGFGGESSRTVRILRSWTDTTLSEHPVRPVNSRQNAGALILTGQRPCNRDGGVERGAMVNMAKGGALGVAFDSRHPPVHPKHPALPRRSGSWSSPGKIEGTVNLILDTPPASEPLKGSWSSPERTSTVTAESRHPAAHRLDRRRDARRPTGNVESSRLCGAVVSMTRL